MVVMVAPVDPKRARTFDHESLPWPKVEEKRSEPSPALDRDRDIHLLDFAKNAIRATAAREGELNDSILYAGMNPSSAPTELAGLRANGANVTATRSQGNVTDTLAFAKSIGLSGEQAQRVADILSSTKNNGELAAIAKVWASGRAPSRLVLSGHSGGSDVHAGYDHVIRFKDVQRLAAAMPGAAACIEDIHLSGCNTGLEATSKEERDQWVRAFPNLQTLWGYQGSCPTAPGGDMAIWESRTRGRAHLDLSGLEKTPIVISDRFGHIDGAAVRKPLAEVLADLKWAKEEHPKLMAGDIRSWGGGDDDPECPHGLYQTYQALRRAQARDDVDPTARVEAKEMADQLLRVRCWQSVCHHFQAEHRAELDAAKLDFTKLTRKEAVQAIAASTVSEPLRGALLDLKDHPERLPEEWCEHELPR